MSYSSRERRSNSAGVSDIDRWKVVVGPLDVEAFRTSVVIDLLPIRADEDDIEIATLVVILACL
jgi:hypothetical protein